MPGVARFSELAFTWIWTGSPHKDRLWLRSRSTLQSTALDRLAESLGDAKRETLWDGTARYTFERDDVRVCVTTEHETSESMWWLEAVSEDRLAKAGRKGPADWARGRGTVGPAGRAAQSDRLAGIVRPLVNDGLLTRNSLRR